MDVTAYARQLIALLPQGAAFTADAGSVLKSFLLGIAEEYARVDARARDLVNEWDPRTTFELLPDWERLFGLPDGCTDVDSSIALRRAVIVGRVVAIGGQSIAYFTAVALAMGYAITITEFTPFDVSMDVDSPLYGDGWAYTWQVNHHMADVIEFTVDDAVSEALASWDTDPLICAMRRLKPAHTTVLFAEAA